MGDNKPLILIGSCSLYRNNGYNDAARNTWIKDWGSQIAYRFILGRGCMNPRPDEIILDVDDGYEQVTYKTREAHRWALQNGYGYTFLCFTDTYVVPPRLLNSDFASYDYSGFVVSFEGISYAGGGTGYWLSPKASEFIVAAQPQSKHESWCEDLWTGRVLHQVGIIPVHSNILSPGKEGKKNLGLIPVADTVLATEHLSINRSYDPSWMYDTHRRVGRTV